MRNMILLAFSLGLLCCEGAQAALGLGVSDKMQECSVKFVFQRNNEYFLNLSIFQAVSSISISQILTGILILELKLYL